MKTILKLTLAAAALLMVSGMNNASAQKFGYIDVQELVFSMPDMEKVRADFEAFQKELEAQYDTMVVEFNKKREEYERTMSTMTEGTRKIKEEELQSIMQRIQAFEQSIQTDLQQTQNKLLEPLFAKAQAAVEAVAKAQGLAGVFAAAALVYTDKATMVDVLPLAKSHLGIQ